MTRQEQITALAHLMDRDATYDGGKIILTFEGHGEALSALMRARRALRALEALDQESDQ